MPRYDVAVVGGGPTGLSAGIHAARAGLRTLVIERAVFPHEKVCGDGQSPLSIGELSALDVEVQALGAHRVDGLQINAFESSHQVPWPAMHGYPNWGACLRREHLGQAIVGIACGSGVEIWEETEGLAPIQFGGQVVGVKVRRRTTKEEIDVLATWTVLADGATCLVSRRLGIRQDPRHGPATGLRGYFRSDHASEPYMTIYLDMRDPIGRLLPSHGWVFPLGDGTVNVGFGIHPRLRGFEGLDLHQIWSIFLDRVAGPWRLERSPSQAPRGWNLPMGLQKSKLAGPGFLVVGDAAAAINPLNGEGVAYALLTGRMAALAIKLADTEQTRLDLARRYERELHAKFDEYYRAGLAVNQWIDTHTDWWQWLVRACIRSRTATTALVRLVAGLPRRDWTPWERLFVGLASRLGS